MVPPPSPSLPVTAATPSCCNGRGNSWATSIQLQLDYVRSWAHPGTVAEGLTSLRLLLGWWGTPRGKEPVWSAAGIVLNRAWSPVHPSLGRAGAALELPPLPGQPVTMRIVIVLGGEGGTERGTDVLRSTEGKEGGGNSYLIWRLKKCPWLLFPQCAMKGEWDHAMVPPLYLPLEWFFLSSWVWKTYKFSPYTEGSPAILDCKDHLKAANIF